MVILAFEAFHAECFRFCEYASGFASGGGIHYGDSCEEQSVREERRTDVYNLPAAVSVESQGTGE